MLDPLSRLLKGQRAYGSSSATWHDDVFGLGRNLHPILPEDRFDQGPIRSESHWLVADLRLDNRDELGASLRLPSARLADLSDCALLFKCLLEWGETAVDRLVGEFAFAWWDTRRRRLLMGRDILGYRPLVFHRANKFIAFASMPSGLHALDDVPYAFDPNFMAESLALIPRYDRRTHFSGIERVQPAHLIRIDADGEQSWRYWQPTPPKLAANDPVEQEEELRRLVDVAVAAQLRGAGKIASTHLSAGLDSSIITSSAALQFAPNPILAFTAVPTPGFDGPVPSGVMANEGPDAAAVAQRYPNIEHILVESTGTSPLEALDSDFAYMQQPAFNLDNAVWSRAINRLAHDRGVKVMLTGTFGNLTATYAGLEYLGWLVGHGQIAKALNISRSLRANGTPLRSIVAHLAGPFLPTAVWSAAATARGWVLDLQKYTAVSAAQLGRVKEAAEACDYDLSFRPSRDPMKFRFNILSEYDFGNYTKAALAEWGISLRDPLTDRRVIEFSLSAPQDEFVRGGKPRSLARRAFADRLPETIVNGLVRGYQAADWYISLTQDQRNLRGEVDAIARCMPAAAAMDLNWLQQAASSWPTDRWADKDIVMRYRYGMLRAIANGHFMRKVTRSN